MNLGRVGRVVHSLQKLAALLALLWITINNHVTSAHYTEPSRSPSAAVYWFGNPTGWHDGKVTPCVGGERFHHVGACLAKTLPPGSSRQVCVVTKTTRRVTVRPACYRARPRKPLRA